MTSLNTRFAEISLITAAALLASPVFAFAQTYAYVNTSGDVTTVEAASAATALTTAPNMAVHSGVILLNSPEDQEVVGDDVSGV
jgi:hypothetical protein